MKNHLHIGFCFVLFHPRSRSFYSSLALKLLMPKAKKEHSLNFLDLICEFAFYSEHFKYSNPTLSSGYKSEQKPSSSTDRLMHPAKYRGLSSKRFDPPLTVLPWFHVLPAAV